jgi:hypothetical protein
MTTTIMMMTVFLWILNGLNQSNGAPDAVKTDTIPTKNSHPVHVGNLLKNRVGVYPRTKMVPWRVWMIRVYCTRVAKNVEAIAKPDHCVEINASKNENFVRQKFLMRE